MNSEQNGRKDASLPGAREQLRRLAGLSPGWDSYGGAPIDQCLTEAADGFLGALAQAGLELPAFVPGSDGSLALEWQRPGRELPITLSGDESDLRIALFLVAPDGSEREEEPAVLEIATVAVLIAQLGRNGAEPLAQLEEGRP